MRDNPRTIGQAELECRSAWLAHPKAKYGWCVHHDTELEVLTEPIENRILFIVKEKPKNQLIVRLDNLRPVLSTKAIKAQKAYDKATAPAWKAYEEVLASARKTYEEAKATAWKVYEEATATAQKAYEESTATAQKAYD